MVPHYLSNLTTNFCLARIKLLDLFDRQSRFFVVFGKLTAEVGIPIFVAVKLRKITTTKTVPPAITTRLSSG